MTEYFRKSSMFHFFCDKLAFLDYSPFFLCVTLLETGLVSWRTAHQSSRTDNNINVDYKVTPLGPIRLVDSYTIRCHFVCSTKKKSSEKDFHLRAAPLFQGSIWRQTLLYILCYIYHHSHMEMVLFQTSVHTDKVARPRGTLLTCCFKDVWAATFLFSREREREAFFVLYFQWF